MGNTPWLLLSQPVQNQADNRNGRNAVSSLLRFSDDVQIFDYVLPAAKVYVAQFILGYRGLRPACHGKT